MQIQIQAKNNVHLQQLKPMLLDKVIQYAYHLAELVVNYVVLIQIANIMTMDYVPVLLHSIILYFQPQLLKHVSQHSAQMQP